MENNEMPVVFTVKQTANILNCTPQMVYNMVTDKTLPAFRIGNRLRIKKDDLLGYIRLTSTDG